MPDANYDNVYDPLATPNPAYDDDFDPAPERRSGWERRSLAQALLARARARQDAIADAFVDSLIGGKISLFRLLMDLEQAAAAGEAEAQEARLPTLAELLIPMLDRERKQAAEVAADQAANQASENAAVAEAAGTPALTPAQPVPALDPPALALAPSSEAVSVSELQTGVTELHAAAEPVTEAAAEVAAKPRSCRSGSQAHASCNRRNISSLQDMRREVKGRRESKSGKSQGRKGGKPRPIRDSALSAQTSSHRPT